MTSSEKSQSINCTSHDSNDAPVAPRSRGLLKVPVPPIMHGASLGSASRRQHPLKLSSPRITGRAEQPNPQLRNFSQIIKLPGLHTRAQRCFPERPSVSAAIPFKQAAELSPCTMCYELGIALGIDEILLR